MYVTDPEGYRVLVFDQYGKFLTTWGDFGTKADLWAGGGLAMDAAGKMFVADAGNQRVMKFPALP